MKKVFLLLILMALGGVSYSQVRIVDNDSLKSVITASDKPYKLIYVFCDYCPFNRIGMATCWTP